jgi:hypothetical protein
MAGPTITRNVNFSWNNGITSVGNAVKTATLLGSALNAIAFSNTQSVDNTLQVVELLDVPATTREYVLMLTNKDTVSASSNYVIVQVYNGTGYTIVGRMYQGESWGPVRMVLGATPRFYVATATATAINVEVICGEALIV